MKRSSVLFTAATAAMMLLLLGCSGGADAPGSSGELPGAGENPDGDGPRDGARDGGTSSEGPPDGQAARTDGGDGGKGNPEDEDADIQLTFQGCSPVFEDVRVTTNVVAFDSIGVSSAYAPMNGGVQIAIKDAAPRTISISTLQRTQSQNSVVINVFAGGTTYSNLCNSSSGCTYNAQQQRWDNDPISGTFRIGEYDPQAGKLDVGFTNVVLQHVSGAGLCKVSGTLRTKRLSK